jgi:hypothetical protein
VPHNFGFGIHFEDQRNDRITFSWCEEIGFLQLEPLCLVILVLRSTLRTKGMTELRSVGVKRSNRGRE